MPDFYEPNAVQREIATKTEAARARADAMNGWLAQCAAEAAAIRAKADATREQDRRGRAELVQIMLDPRHQADAVLARAKFSAPVLSADAKLPSQIVWMPKGVHEISSGTLNGGSWNGAVIVDAVSAANVINSFETLRAAGERLFVDFAHRDSEAAAWVAAFSWDPERGICATVTWTSAGEEAVRGGVFASFSPTFYVESDGHVSGLVPGSAVGGLVNNPAFKQMPSLTAGARTQSALMLRQTLVETGVAPEIADRAADAVEAGYDGRAVALLVQTLASA